jgi:hypothetical protein
MQAFLKRKSVLVILVLIGIFSALTDVHVDHEPDWASAQSAANTDQTCCVQCCPIHNLFPTVEKVSLARGIFPTLSIVISSEVLFLESPYLSTINRPPIFSLS